MSHAFYLFLGILQHTNTRFGMDRKSALKDLKAELIKLMFSADRKREPVLVTTDPGKFTMVMSAFTAYENQVHLCIPLLIFAVSSGVSSVELRELEHTPQLWHNSDLVSQ